MGRAPCCDKANVKKGPWSPEEDATLKGYIDKYGTGGNWIALPQKIGLRRCGKSCRLRWLNYLRPNIKHGGFSEEEDNIICSLYISIGSRWSVIAAQLPGRTDNDIKNYWNTKLKKKLLGRRKQCYSQMLSTTDNQSQDNINININNANASDQQHNYSLSNSALERLQLHMHLQSLQNPHQNHNSNFCNNPAPWPKLHPLQQKMMIQTLQCLYDHTDTTPNAHPPIQQAHLPTPPQQLDSCYSPINSSNVVRVVEELDNSLNGTMVPLGQTSSIAFNGTADAAVPDSTIGAENLSQLAEFDGLMSSKAVGFVEEADGMAEFDCFKEMEDCSSRERLIGWSNGMEPKSSASPNSWDSTCLLYQQSDQGMYQGFVLGYNDL